MPTMPDIICTVAIPVYNRIRYLRGAVDSVLNQDVNGQKVEILIVDDGSREDVWRELQTLSHPSIKLHRNAKNLGLFPNWNECLRLAQGRYFKILCSDDVLAPGTLAKEISFMEGHPDVALLSTRGVYVDTQDRVVGQTGTLLKGGTYDGSLATKQLLQHYFRTGVSAFNYPSGTLVPTIIAREVGGYDTTMRHVGDLDFFYKVMTRGRLGIADWEGCRITLHPEQEGAIQSVKTYGVEENFTIIGRHRHLFSDGEYNQLRRLHCGLTLWYGVKLLAKKNLQGFRDYGRVAYREACTRRGLLDLLAGFAQFVFWKGYLYLFADRSPWVASLKSSQM
jgi:glycosyltransferase involved in cell wall biosynthesis